MAPARPRCCAACAELVAALAADPPILLLDEPFANLDAVGGEVLAGWLRAWAAERLVVLTGHAPPPVPCGAIDLPAAPPVL
jgi:ABC-type molybdenum transport system ATPase subunit/photorepair protein PhrA